MISFPTIWFNVLRTIYESCIKQQQQQQDHRHKKDDDHIDLDDDDDMTMNNPQQSSQKKIKQRLWYMFIKLMNGILFSLILVIILQQLVELNTTWHQKINERDIKLQRWKHDCGDPSKPPMDPDIIDICNQLKIVKDASPFIRALSKVIYSWNSCITMSCSDLLTKMTTNIEWKILLVCVIIALCNYIYKFFGYAKKKTDTLQNYIQLKHTMKQEKKRIQNADTMGLPAHTNVVPHAKLMKTKTNTTLFKPDYINNNTIEST